MVATTTIKPWQVEPMQMPSEAIELLSGDRKSLLEWMEEDYFLSRKVHGLSDRWSRDYGPFWVPVIERLDDSTTREIWGFAPAQSGKSTVGTGWMGYTVDVEPVPMALVMPRDKDASERMETNIVPMFEANPRLLQHCGGRASNINIGKLTMFDHMAFYLLYANTAAELAGKSICRIQADEVGKYPAQVGVEADPISLMRKRLRTFKTRSKLYAVTTPVLKGDLSDVNWSRGDCCEWWVPCVHCSAWQRPTWSDVKLDKTETDELLSAEEYRRGGRARYVCPHCHEAWDESQRWEAVMAGQYVPKGGRIDENGTVVVQAGSDGEWRPYRPGTYFSFRITALLLHPAILTIDDLAADWSDAVRELRHGNSLPMQDFINSNLAEVWEERRKETEESVLVPHVSNLYERGVVPPGAQYLTLSYDVQLDHVWAMLIGWGWQFEAWVIFAGRLETGDTERLPESDIVRQFCHTRWPRYDYPDATMRIDEAGIDSQYNTDAVNECCRRWVELNLKPLMGLPEDRKRGRLFSESTLATGLVRYDVNVDRFKDMVYRMLFVADEPGPGYLHLYKDFPEEYLKQFCAERNIKKKKGNQEFNTWVLKEGHRPNHLWDCLVYGRLLAELAGVAGCMTPQVYAEQLRLRHAQQQQNLAEGDHRRERFIDNIPGVN